MTDDGNELGDESGGEGADSATGGDSEGDEVSKRWPHSRRCSPA